jgi:hypothetical protein
MHRVQVRQRLIRFARKSFREQLAIVQRQLGRPLIPRWYVPHLRNDRTAYVIGLGGSGRTYLNDLIVQNIGERAKYFRNAIRFHPRPTSMIYSGHATMRYIHTGALSPAVTRRIIEATRLGFADLIFIYRHPLDSLLTNWVWYRENILNKRGIVGIADVYKNTDDFCAALEANFSELAECEAGSFLTAPGARCLSLQEFIEETELFLSSATLTMRLEDFMIDPLKEFSKIAEVMSADLDLSRRRITAPRATPYRYLAVKKNVTPFRDLINALDAETKTRIEKMGYAL